MKNVIRLFLLAFLVFLGAKVLSTDFDKAMKNSENPVIVNNY